MESAATVATPQASRYLQQLCKHFAHKIETEFDATRGVCRFPHSTAHLAAGDDALAIRIEADSVEDVERGQAVIWNHLVRFAFREDLGRPDWTEPAPSA